MTTLLLVSPETYAAREWALLPAALRAPPEGLAWAAAHLPITPSLAHAAQWLLVASAVTGLLGLFSRVSLALVTLSGLYVLGLSQLGGAVVHDMHLLWFSALLATAPCGDAVSLDRLLARRRGAPEPLSSLRVGVPLTAVRVLLGLVYFFPGFWKLAESGVSWVFSDNLLNQMYFKWYQHGAVPVLRIDRHPALVRAGAAAVVLLELSFPLLVLFQRTRLVAALGGLAFHLATQLLLFIPFVSLWGCYTALVDWGREDEPLRAPEANASLRAIIVSGSLGLVLVAGVVVQGARNAIQAWPFACYPTFQWRVGSTMPDLVMEAVAADGTHWVLPDGPGAGGSRSQSEWGTAWRVAGLYGDPPTPERLAAYWQRARLDPRISEAARSAHDVRFYRAWYSVVPEHARRPPVRAEMIGIIRP